MLQVVEVNQYITVLMYLSEGSADRILSTRWEEYYSSEDCP